MFSRVKACGVPVLGIITDKEAAFVTAAKSVFSEVPHQYCQTHYLQNVIKPMESDLSDLARGVRGMVNRVKEVEKKLRDVDADPKERELVREFCQVAKTAGKTRGDKLVNPTAVKRFLRLEQVTQAVKKARKQPGSWPLLARLEEVLSRLDSYHNLVDLLQDQVDVVRNVSHILKEGGDSSQRVKGELKGYLEELEEDVPEDEPRWCSFVEHVVGVTLRFWEGLFHCYDQIPLPSTNNSLEGLFGAIKRQQRKVTGRSSTAGGPLETCAAYVLGAWSVTNTHSDLVSLLEGTNSKDLALARERLEELAHPAKRKRSIARDPDRYLSGLLKNWAKTTSTTS
jgi:hypothetical protein